MNVYLNKKKRDIDVSLTYNRSTVFTDGYCHILVDNDSHGEYFFAQSDQKVCIIFGDISIPTLESINPAQYYLDLYYDNPEKFLLVTQGKFLLVQYDTGKQTLRYARDILGLAHGYYAYNNDGICISTGIIPVLQYKGRGTNHIDVQSLNLYLTFQYVPQPFTLFSDIHQIPLNSILEYKDRSVVSHTFQSSYIDGISKHTGNSDEGLKDILIASFQRQIPTNDQNIGGFLSGGMDTSSNIAVLSSFMDIKPTVFTASFEEQEYDETPYAKIVAKHFNLKHKIVNINKNCIKFIPEICALYDNPIADRAILPEYVICKLANEMGITHMISGEGGDEVLGYPRNLPEDFSNSLYDNLLNHELSNFYLHFSALLQEDLRKDLFANRWKSVRHKYLTEVYNSISSDTSFEKMYFGQWQTWMIDNVFIKDIQLFKKFGLGFISPYMDVQLMKHCLQIPPSKKLKLFKNKKYLKDTLADVLPSQIISKPKHKFHVPIAEWIRADLFEQMHDTILAENSISSKFLNKKVIQQMLTEHKNGTTDYNRPLWGLFFLESWYTMKKSYL